MHRTWVALVALMAFASVGVEEAQALPAAVEIVNATLEVPLTGSRWFASTQNASLTVPGVWCHQCVRWVVCFVGVAAHGLRA